MPSSAQPIGHYENFPVASWLCPPRLRPPIAAIYHFARTADDLADEGEAAPADRLQALRDYRAELHACAAGAAPAARWAQVFGPLQVQMRAFALPVPLLEALLDAFEQDVHMSAQARAYADMPALLDYCSRSANPVGRLLLHLYGVDDARALAQSDAICTALQLINFWQDLSVDIPRGRYYLPLAECARHGIHITQPAVQFAALPRPQAAGLIEALCLHAGQTMQAGAPLVHHLPGRVGWELRAVVQGALCVLRKTRALGVRALDVRPRLHASDVPGLLWRCFWMR